MPPTTHPDRPDAASWGAEPYTASRGADPGAASWGTDSDADSWGTGQHAWGADPYADALRSGRGPLFLRRSDGWLLPLEVERWCARADAADLSALRRCTGSVLDIGCGPGRLVAALAAQGRRTLGIDVSAAAVARTTAIGGTALHCSVFNSLPGEGTWDTALLLDGNIGIGGDPRALLARTAELVAPHGLLIVETTPADVDEQVRVRVEGGDHPRPGVPRTPGDLFPWARVGAPALLRYAAATGWIPAEQWTAAHPAGQAPAVAQPGQSPAVPQSPGAERCFVSLSRPAVPGRRG
ncbi:class I SAM-dependent methyltransferase [Streptomyces tubercidicus]|uniref:class I SAM-dependent methyltransferase n=1 Tax=Streptomyces tubercidicus TaxID=47759 RepID=UPI001FE7AED8|nr:methyltransferase domain-containing protein [Streptomyces tubercidicus]WAU11253.1 class I SAM-dependent methyltransferase [Streptomyces tubercidicus]